MSVGDDGDGECVYILSSTEITVSCCVVCVYEV